MEAKESNPMNPRILVWDIENYPALGWFYGPTYNTNIIKVEQPSRVCSFAAKWLGDKKVEYRSTFHDGEDEMVARAWTLLDEADAVVSYNGKRHDTPHMTTEFLRDGAGGPSPFKEIDLYQVVRSRLKFQQNRLNFVLQDLTIGKKVEHEGNALWFKCMAGDEKAWARFKRYNIGDVVETEKLYWRLLPHIPRSMLPNRNLYSDADVCPSCGSGHLQRRGYSTTLTAVYPRFHCQGCGSWSQGKNAVKRVDVRGAA